MDLSGALVVIGGGSQGIGAGLARACAARGAREVVLLARRGGPLADLAAQIGARASWHTVDLSVPDQVADVARRIQDRSGTPDVVVASSANGRFLGLRESVPQDAVDAMASTYFAAYFLFRAFVEGLLARGSGRFVVVGSPVRAGPFPALAYKASRHALHGFAEGLREDLRATGLGVTYAEPSRIKEGSYFKSNPGVLERLPSFMRDERFARFWQTEDQAGAMIADAVEDDRDFASPGWLRVASGLTSLTKGGFLRLLERATGG